MAFKASCQRNALERVDYFYFFYDIPLYVTEMGIRCQDNVGHYLHRNVKPFEKCQTSPFQISLQEMR